MNSSNGLVAALTSIQRRTDTTPAVATSTPLELFIYMHTRDFSEQTRCGSTVSRGHSAETGSSPGRLGDPRFRERVRGTTTGAGIRI